MKFKALLVESVQWSYFNKFRDITKKYMPDRGEGETMASQGVTAVNKLVYKWYNDGDVYDNTSPNGLQGWANDLSTYANWLYKYMPETKELLDGIFDCASDSDYEYLLKAVADTVLDEEFLQSYSDKPVTGSIYEEDGPYRFIEDWDDPDDDYDYYDDDETGYEDDEYDYDDGEEDFDESLQSTSDFLDEALKLKNRK